MFHVPKPPGGLEPPGGSRIAGAGQLYSVSFTSDITDVGLQNTDAIPQRDGILEFIQKVTFFEKVTF